MNGFTVINTHTPDLLRIHVTKVWDDNEDDAQKRPGQVTLRLNADGKEIEEYVHTNEPMDKAGSYAIQGDGAKFVRSIDGDFYTIVGLPVAELYHRLKKYLSI